MHRQRKVALDRCFPAVLLEGERQLEMVVVEIEQPVEEGGETLAGRRPGSQRRRAGYEGVLERSEVLVGERLEQAGAVTETTKDGSLADPRLVGDDVDRRALGAALGQDPASRLENPHTVCRRIGTFAGRPRHQE